MSNVNEAVVRYISVWNERDARRRRALVVETRTEDGSYVDAHRTGRGTMKSMRCLPPRKRSFLATVSI
jgi:hypothetical protein